MTTCLRGLLIALALSALGLLPAGSAAAQTAATSSTPSLSSTFCPAGQSPRYGLGFAELKARLADWMGEPLTCEFPDPNASGDVHQRTTRGLAFWRKSTNTATFTNGAEHWALAASGLVYWQGASIDPAPNAIAGASNPCLLTGACLSPGPGATATAALINPPPAPARPPVASTYTFEVVGPLADTMTFACLKNNPSCARDPWWIEANELQDSTPVQFSFVGPGFIAERRFAEVVWLLWQWPDGQALLQQAAANGVALVSAVGGADAGAFAYYQPDRNVIMVNRTFARTATWMVADIIAHELTHAADYGAGLLTGSSPADCIAREQRGYQTEYRYQTWLAKRSGGLPNPVQMLDAGLSAENYDLYVNLFRLGTASDVDALAATDYRRVCAQ